MRWLRVLLGVAGLLLGAQELALAGSKGFKGYGDDNIFPITCIDFSGSWNSDTGSRYKISQVKCSWIQIHSLVNNQPSYVTIVPDDKMRNLSNEEYRGTVRYRWNEKKAARIIETHRSLTYKDRRVKEVVTLEMVNNDLLLESTYRMIEPAEGEEGGKPRQEVEQQVFRRVR